MDEAKKSQIWGQAKLIGAIAGKAFLQGAILVGAAFVGTKLASAHDRKNTGATARK